MAVDPVRRELYYLNQGLRQGSPPPALLVIDLDAPSGVAYPKRISTGTSTMLGQPEGIAYDANSGNIYVADAKCTYASCGGFGGSILVFLSGASGNVAPTAAIAGDKAYLQNLHDVVTFGNTLYASGDGAMACTTRGGNSCTDGVVSAFTLRSPACRPARPLTITPGPKVSSRRRGSPRTATDST